MVQRTAIGLMSGTSMDGVDAALVRTDGGGRVETGASLTVPYADDLKAALRAILGNRHAPAPLVAALTEANANAVAALLATAGLGAEDIDVVGFHGQTIFHRPNAGITVQIGDPAQLAKRLAIDVVADFRSADVAAGGQGAPFVPLYHAALARELEKPLAIVNIGGVSNVTWIGGALDIDGMADEPDAILAFDTGPGNALLDDWVQSHTGAAYDEGGRLALAGRADELAVARFMENEFFRHAPPKSLDREDFADARLTNGSVADGAATYSAFTAAAIAASAAHLPEPPRQWLVTGGGRHNPAIMAELSRRVAAQVRPVEAVGWDGDALEAQAFAWLAVRSLRGLPLSVPATTGCRAPTPGGVLVRAA